MAGVALGRGVGAVSTVYHVDKPNGQVSKEYFECHITIDPRPLNPALTIGEWPRYVQHKVEAARWVFSHIHHDIVLGVGPKLYATTHFNVDRMTVDQVWAAMQNLRNIFEGDYGIRVLRCKIERVLRDERYDQ